MAVASDLLAPSKGTWSLEGALKVSRCVVAVVVAVHSPLVGAYSIGHNAILGACNGHEAAANHELRTLELGWLWYWWLYIVHWTPAKGTKALSAMNLGSHAWEIWPFPPLTHQPVAAAARATDKRGTCPTVTVQLPSPPSCYPAAT